MIEAPSLPLPAYGTGSLAELLPSVAAGQRVAGFDNPLNLTGADHAVVLLIDGLGWELLLEHRDEAPFLASLIPAGRSLTCAFPATTATSLGSFGTGLPPGAHGLVGYTFRLPPDGPVVNALRWDTKVDPLTVQTQPTVFERCAAAGVQVSHVALRHFNGSGLTRAALRGALYPGADTMGEAVEAARVALATAREAKARSLIFVYTGDLDNVGHARGCGSVGWRAQLAHADLLARQLSQLLPSGAALYITADHGMVNVPAEHRIDLEREPVLLAGVRAVAGEPRARHIYAKAGAAPEVVAAWRERLLAEFWVFSKAEAIAMGLFGAVAERVLPSIGDVVALARGGHALCTPVAHPGESALLGHHGALTPAELYVPLLTFEG